MFTNELDLVKKCQTGEIDAFAELYDLYVDKIYKFIFFRTSHRETAEDLTSLTFTKALEKIKDFNIELGYFSAWIYRIARNTVIDFYRTKKNKQNSELTEETEDENNVEYDIDIKCSLEKVKTQIDKLSKEQKDILIMRIWDGLSYEEISKIVGKSEANCKVITSRALSMIRKESAITFLTLMFIQFISNIKK